MILSWLIWQETEENNDIKYLIEGNPLNKKAEERGARLEILKKRKDEPISEIKAFPYTGQYLLYRR